MKQHELIALREKVLKKVRNSLIQKSEINTDSIDFSLPVFESDDSVPEIRFARNWNASGGKFFYAISSDELFMAIRKILSFPEISTVYIPNEKQRELFETSVPEYKHLITTQSGPDTLVVLFPECFISDNGTVIFSRKNPDFFAAIPSLYHTLMLGSLEMVLPAQSDFRKFCIAEEIESFVSLTPQTAADAGKHCFVFLSEPKLFS